ncbi:MAG: DNA polymerase I, partial [Oscillospiraceae bacterium]|nr:DNA polymerase I [Oscillospiraceae bacterium]
MKILAIDGNSIMNRAFYGIKMLSNSKGFFTNALTGFMNIYMKETEAVQPDCVAVAFDLKAPTFRHKKVASYKANRKGMPEELFMQMPKIKEILTAMGVKILEVEGFEADDVLGTISKIFNESNNHCYILTGDRDSLQLVNENVTVRLATNKETVIYTPEKIKEVYGLSPKQLIEVKALMGDSSDNISGVAGIGEKTALSLISQYGSVDGVYENLKAENFTKSVFTKLSAGKDDAYLSRWLGTIVTDAPIENDCQCYALKPQNNSALREILSDLEMFKLLERICDNSDSPAEEIVEEKIKLSKIKVSKLDENIIKSLTENDEVCFIFKNNSLSLYAKDEIYLSEEISEQATLFDDGNDTKSLVLDFFECPCKKICFEGKTAYKFAFSNDRELKNLIFNCDLAGYLLNSQASDYTVENLCASYKTIYRRDMGENSDIASLSPLYKRLCEEIKLKEMENLLYEIEQPLCEVLASREVYGVKAYVEGIKAFGVELTQKIK